VQKQSDAGTNENPPFQRGIPKEPIEPEAALSDGYQSLDFEQFEQFMAICKRVAEAVGKRMEPSSRKPGK
jgi:hypothetical protein